MIRSAAIGAEVPANPCSTRFAWSIPTCWQWPKSFIYARYPAPPAPPVVGSTLPDGSPIDAIPAGEEDANATIDAIIAAQKEAADAQAQEFFQRLNEQLKEETPWWLWPAVVLGVLAAGSVILKGHRR